MTYRPLRVEIEAEFEQKAKTYAADKAALYLLPSRFTESDLQMAYFSGAYDMAVRAESQRDITLEEDTAALEEQCGIDATSFRNDLAKNVKPTAGVLKMATYAFRHGWNTGVRSAFKSLIERHTLISNETKG